MATFILYIAMPTLLLVSGALASDNSAASISSSSQPIKSTLTRKQFVSRYQKLGPQDLYAFDVNRDTYKLVTLLGKGASSAVYLCDAEKGAKGPARIAIKTIFLDEIDENLRRMTEKEMYKLKVLDHPNVMKLFHGHVRHTEIIIAGEYFEQGSFEMYEVGQAKFGMLPFPRIQRIIKDILSALAYMHSYGMIHRDIKPANIMLAGKGAKLIDFGFCTEPTENDQQLVCSPGSPLYAAPEIYLQLPHNSAIDMWSLGIVVWMLFNNPYFRVPAIQTATELFDLVRLKKEPWHGREELPACIQVLVGKIVKYNQEERAGASKLLSELSSSWAEHLDY